MNGKGCGVNKIAWILVIIGGLNWGLVGVGMFTHNNFNLVNLLLGKMPMIEAVVYLVVGIATIATLIGCKCATCTADKRM